MDKEFYDEWEPKLLKALEAQDGAEPLSSYAKDRLERAKNRAERELEPLLPTRREHCVEMARAIMIQERVHEKPLCPAAQEALVGWVKASESAEAA